MQKIVFLKVHSGNEYKVRFCFRFAWWPCKLGPYSFPVLLCPCLVLGGSPQSYLFCAEPPTAPGRQLVGDFWRVSKKTQVEQNKDPLGLLGPPRIGEGLSVVGRRLELLIPSHTVCPHFIHDTKGSFVTFTKPSSVPVGFRVSDPHFSVHTDISFAFCSGQLLTMVERKSRLQYQALFLRKKQKSKRAKRRPMFFTVQLHCCRVGIPHWGQNEIV